MFPDVEGVRRIEKPLRRKEAADTAVGRLLFRGAICGDGDRDFGEAERQG